MCAGLTNIPLVYVITNQRSLEALYVGKTGTGFASRYHGGTHNAVNAAIDSSKKSKNIILLGTPKNQGEDLNEIEKELIMEWKPKWNQQHTEHKRPKYPKTLLESSKKHRTGMRPKLYPKNESPRCFDSE